MQEFEIIEYLNNNNIDCVDLILLSSWGLDGSSGHSQYNQLSKTTSPNSVKDNDLLATTTTPIQLFERQNCADVFWCNLLPQSVRFCRPLILEFVKESKEVVLATKMEIEGEINELTPKRVDLSDGKFVLVDFKFVMSLIDGKVLAIITNTKSMMNCPICGATPNAMSDITQFEKGFKVNETALCYGISPLHCWIRFFECLLHISYRLDFMKWKVTAAFKEMYEQRKKLIKKKLYDSFGIKVDEPRAGGLGNSTTGNVCRRAFSNSTLLGSILGIDEDIISRFHNILISLNCHVPVNPEKFDTYCRATYRLYLSKYGWYKIPSTIHRVLAHGGEIIMHSPAPLGSLGEEGAESRNKDYRKFRRDHARKTSREDNLYDIFNRCMISSDPLISSLSIGKRLKNKKILDLPDVVKEFLVFEDGATAAENGSSNRSSLDEVFDEIDDFDDDLDLDDVNVEFE